MLHGTPVLYTEMSPNCGNTEVDIAQKQLHRKDGTTLHPSANPHSIQKIDRKTAPFGQCLAHVPFQLVFMFMFDPLEHSLDF